MRVNELLSMIYHTQWSQPGPEVLSDKSGVLPQRKKERKEGKSEDAKEPRIGATNQTMRE